MGDRALWAKSCGQQFAEIVDRRLRKLSDRIQEIPFPNIVQILIIGLQSTNIIKHPEDFKGHSIRCILSLIKATKSIKISIQLHVAYRNMVIKTGKLLWQETRTR